jgi:hypothetical protein
MAISDKTFGDAGAATSDIFAGFAAQDKIKGDELEASSYSDAAALANQNAQFTAQSTAIQEAQQERELYLSTGKTTSQVAGAGFALSGSALDILRSSASQGSLQKAVVGEQGMITEAGYNEQAASYTNMANAANAAAKGENLAGTGDFVAGGISAVAAIATL